MPIGDMLNDRGNKLLAWLKSKGKPKINTEDTTQYECQACGLIFDLNKNKFCPECGVKYGEFE